MGESSQNPFVYQLSVDWNSDDQNRSYLRAEERMNEILRQEIRRQARWRAYRRLFESFNDIEESQLMKNKRKSLFIFVEDF